MPVQVCDLDYSQTVFNYFGIGRVPGTALARAQVMKLAPNKAIFAFLVLIANVLDLVGRTSLCFEKCWSRGIFSNIENCFIVCKRTFQTCVYEPIGFHSNQNNPLTINIWQIYFLRFGKQLILF